MERLLATPDATLIRIHYPENRRVSHQQVMTWAADALANGETDKTAGNIVEAMDILMHIGEVEFDSRDYAVLRAKSAAENILKVL